MAGAACTVRLERAADHDAVFRVHRQAFGRDAEARIVDALRADAHPLLSLVAKDAGTVVGHVMLSPVTLEGPSPPPAAGLGPIGVTPARQRGGIGSALVREALRRAPSLGWEAIFLVGDPAYYARFGFRAAAPPFTFGDPAVDPALQALELRPGALAGRAGRVRYHPAFLEDV